MTIYKFATTGHSSTSKSCAFLMQSLKNTGNKLLTNYLK